MEIIRVCEGYLGQSEDSIENTYLLMDVNWLRERCWLVQKYSGSDFFNKHKLIHLQSSWIGVNELIRGLQSKRDTEESRNPETPKSQEIDSTITLDNSKYETKRYFPYFRRRWTNNMKFIKDIPTQNLEEEFPEYLI